MTKYVSCWNIICFDKKNFTFSKILYRNRFYFMMKQVLFRVKTKSISYFFVSLYVRKYYRVCVSLFTKMPSRSIVTLTSSVSRLNKFISYFHKSLYLEKKCHCILFQMSLYLRKCNSIFYLYNFKKLTV